MNKVMVISQRKGEGFTLIELMIVVAIIAILSAIAVPSYQRYVIRTHRTDAMSALQGLAQAMERYRAQQTIANGYLNSANADGSPTMYSGTSPIDGGVARYNLRINLATLTANSYTLQAVPVNAQVGDGVIQLNSAGQRAWDQNDNNVFEANELDWNE